MLIVVGCMWLAVGGIAVAAHLGLRWTINQLPVPVNGNPDIARVVLEPVLDVLLPILLIALALGVLVQTAKLLFSLTRRQSRSSSSRTPRRSEGS